MATKQFGLAPEDANDSVDKSYVDDSISGIIVSSGADEPTEETAGFLYVQEIST